MIELIILAMLVQGPVTPNTPFQLTADHDGTLVTEYRLAQDGAVVQVAPTGKNPTFTIAGKPTGSYSYVVQAVNVPAATHPCVVEATKLGVPKPIEACTGLSASTPLVVVVGTPPPVQTHVSTIAVSPTAATGGQNLAVSWTCTSGCDAKDWIGLFAKGGTGELWWSGQYTQAKPAGSFTRAAPAAAGVYEFRYCRADGYNCPTIAAFTVAGAPVDPCKTDPLTLDVVKDPTGLYVSYVTNKPAKVTVDAGKVTATDARGCVVSK